MSSPLRNKCAVITGASSGIGRAIAFNLADCGMKLCLLGRSLDALNKLAAQLKEKISEVNCYRVDLEQDTEIYSTIDFINKDHKSVDLLIHSAGVIALEKVETAPIEMLDWQFQVNVRAPYILTQAFTPALRKSAGQVVFINSSAAHNASAQVGQYAATKHALKALADSYRMEENGHGIRVLSIYPGRTASPMQKKIFQLEGRKYQAKNLLQPNDIASVVVNSLCLPRSAEVTDVSIRPMKKV